MFFNSTKILLACLSLAATDRAVAAPPEIEQQGEVSANVMTDTPPTARADQVEERVPTRDSESSNSNRRERRRRAGLVSVELSPKRPSAEYLRQDEVSATLSEEPPATVEALSADDLAESGPRQTPMVARDDIVVLVIALICGVMLVIRITKAARSNSLLAKSRQ